MTNRGAFAIGVMVAIGIVLATFSVFFHRSQGARCLDRWGVADANRIRHAAQIEAWKLELAEPSSELPASERPGATATEDRRDSERTVVAGREYSITHRVSLAAARGLVHARHALVVDANYDWSQTDDLAEDQGDDRAAEQPVYSHAILFRDSQAGVKDPPQTILYFDFTRGWVTSDRGRRARLVDKLSQAELAFLERELQRTTPSTPQR
ncbi:MAG: hypothetical protein ACKOU6_07080 [Planctomycetota bacterium]